MQFRDLIYLLIYMSSRLFKVQSFKTHLPLLRPRGYSKARITMMPEGPEVKASLDHILNHIGPVSYLHSSLVQKESYLIDAKIISGKYCRNEPIGWDNLTNALKTINQNQHFCQSLRLSTIECKGKLIYMVFSEPYLSIWSSFGLTGYWSFESTHSHVRLSLTFKNVILDSISNENFQNTNSEIITLYYCDPRNFGNIRISSNPFELQDKLAKLGRDWLSSSNLLNLDNIYFKSKNNTSTNKESPLTLSEFTSLGKLAGAKKRPLCIFLMDQTKTCGIGNYILSEALYIAGIHPFACTSALNDSSWESLYNAIHLVITSSYISQSPFKSLYVKSSKIQQSPYLHQNFEFLIYSRKKTKDRGNSVKRETGTHKRSIHWDPLTQIIHTP